MKPIESPCQTLNRLNNLFSYLENNSYQCKHISLQKLSFQQFKRFPIPQPFIDREIEYLSAAKQQPKQSQQIKVDIKLPDTTKNVESLKEFTTYVQSIRQQRKLKKTTQLDHNYSAINFRTGKKDLNGPQISPKLLRQNSSHQVPQVGKRRNARIEAASPRQSKYQFWAKDFFSKLDNDQLRASMQKQNKNEQQVWSLYHSKQYGRKLIELELKPLTDQAIKSFQKSLIDKIE